MAADERGVHVVWAAEQPSGQSKVFVSNSSDGGASWSDGATLDAEPSGHQWFPDIASADGTITVVFYDSRGDPAYDPNRPPGNTADGKNSGDVVHARIARSIDGGSSWTDSSAVSAAGSNFGWETHGSLRVGFWGDYIYASAVPGAVNVVWTSSRDLVPGADPRETGADDDGDGFDGFQQCTWDPNDINAPSYKSPTVGDPCLSEGALDQNIYGARL